MLSSVSFSSLLPFLIGFCHSGMNNFVNFHNSWGVSVWITFVLTFLYNFIIPLCWNSNAENFVKVMECDSKYFCFQLVVHIWTCLWTHKHANTYCSITLEIKQHSKFSKIHHSAWYLVNLWLAVKHSVMVLCACPRVHLCFGSMFNMASFKICITYILIFIINDMGFL